MSGYETTPKTAALIGSIAALEALLESIKIHEISTFDDVIELVGIIIGGLLDTFGEETEEQHEQA